MKSIVLILTCLLSGVAFSQNVYVIDTAKSQALVYRDDSGKFNGCGIRTVFVSDVPNSSHVGDISVNIVKQNSGNMIGLVKVMYSKIGNLNDPKSAKHLALTKFMFATAAGEAIKLGDVKPGDIPNTYLAQSSAAGAMDYLADASIGKTTQLGIALKSEGSMMRIFSIKNQRLSPDEIGPLAACVKQLSL